MMMLMITRHSCESSAVCRRFHDRGVRLHSAPYVHPVADSQGKDAPSKTSSETTDVLYGPLQEDSVSGQVPEVHSINDRGSDADLPCVERLLSSLQACREREQLARARHAHACICGSGLESHIDVGNRIVSAFAECGNLYDAQRNFHRLDHLRTQLWNSLLLELVRCGQYNPAMCLHKEMQERCIQPDNHALLGLVKACARLNNMEGGQTIHDVIIQRGMENYLFAGSALVDLYAKTGLLTEARKVLQKLAVRNAAPWNALIAGYADHGPSATAIDCYRSMQLEGIPPDATTFICVLKACCAPETSDQAREIHMDIARKGLENWLFIGNTLVDMYVKLGSIGEAQKVFDKMPERDLLSWTALVAGYADHGPYEKALVLVEDMQTEGVLMDATLYLCALKSCKSREFISKGFTIHKEIVQKGFGKDLVVGNALIGMYVTCECLPEAHVVFGKLPSRDVVSWSSFMAGFAENGLNYDVVFDQMQQEGIFLDAVTFACALKAWGNVGDKEKSKGIHNMILLRGFEREVLISHSLVDVYAQSGYLAEAQKVFNTHSYHDVVSWNSLITGHLEHGFNQKVLDFFEQMQLQGAPVNATTYVCALIACGGTGAVARGRKIHKELKEKGLQTDLYVGSALIDMYAKCGSLKESREVFDILPARNIVSWTALIVGYTIHGPNEEALKCFEQMQSEGVAADAEACACALKACGSIGAIMVGQKIHSELVVKGLENNSSVASVLVDIYAKCGSLKDAWKVFEKLPARDAASCSAMMKAYGTNPMVVQFFKGMQEQGVKPDAVSFTCLLSACSRASLVIDGREIFKMMTEEYGIVPTLDHISCMIDLFARAGSLSEAVKFIETIPDLPSKDMWMALLCACKSCGEVELGLHCFEQLTRLSPEWSSPYIFMAKIYASAGRWDDVQKIEDLRVNAGVLKKLACAVIEVNQEVHEFVVGSNNCNEALEAVGKLSLRMGVGGYVPDVDIVLRSEQKDAVGITSHHEYCPLPDDLPSALDILHQDMCIAACG